ncbi:MAG: TolC family protein [Dysgonamonadaceae bacterium]|jgi:outer membrane protein TolC|nr:TolC family protein [Dysgonamonadaceae bacterium]
MKNIQGAVIGIIAAFCFTSGGFAQITLEQCYEKARANYPLIGRYDLIARTRDITLSNVGKANLPQVQLATKASYQSAVTEIPLDLEKLGIPGLGNIPSLSNDQYGVVIDVSQTVWDGGAVASKRAGVKAKSEAELGELEVDLYALRERINGLYFGVLLCDALLDQTRLFMDELQSNHDKIATYLNNGIANPDDLDAVKIEQLRADQTMTRIRYNRKSYVDILSAFLGEQLGEDVIFLRPEAEFSTFLDIRRPELDLFDARIKTLDAARNEINASVMPKFGLFLTGGYGKPGLNMLENKFATYYIGGVRLSWNIGSFLYTRRNSLNLIESSRNTLQTQRETFVFNTLLDKTGKENEIAKYRNLLQSDDKIIALRNSVKRSAEIKLAGGTFNATDLMREVIAEQLAKQDKIIHEIELMQAIYNLKFIINN